VSPEVQRLKAEEARLISEKARNAAAGAAAVQPIAARHRDRIAAARAATAVAAAEAERTRLASEAAQRAAQAASTAAQAARASHGRAEERARQAVADKRQEAAGANPAARQAVDLARQRLSEGRFKRSAAAVGPAHTTLKDTDGTVIYTPESFRPRNPVGANITGTTSSRDYAGRMNDNQLRDAAKFFGGTVSANATRAELEAAAYKAIKDVAHTMAADLPGKYTIRLGMERDRHVIHIEAPGTSITRSFFTVNGKKEVYHSYFNNGGKGDDASKQLYRTSLGVYDKLGISKITVTANISRGGYAWGRYGFVPVHAHDLAGLKDIAVRGLKKLLETGSYNADAYNPNKGETRKPGAKISQEMHDKLLKLASSGDPRDILKVFDAKEGDVKIGAELFMGGHVHWSGAIETHTADYDRTKRYTVSGKT